MSLRHCLSGARRKVGLWGTDERCLSYPVALVRFFKHERRERCPGEPNRCLAIADVPGVHLLGFLGRQNWYPCDRPLEVLSLIPDDLSNSYNVLVCISCKSCHAIDQKPKLVLCTW